MVSWTEMRIAYLVNWLLITRIVSNLEDDKSFLMKYMEIEFQECLEMGSCLRNL